VANIYVDDEITLRWPVMADADELFALTEANRDHLARWLPWAPDHTLESERTWVEGRIKAQTDGTGSPPLLIYRDSLVGFTGVNGMGPLNKSCNLGYYIAESFQGRGIVTRACRGLLPYAFGTMGMNRVQLCANPANTRSVNIPRRLGFTYEGTMREVELLNGRYQDSACYSMLASEWVMLRSAEGVGGGSIGNDGLTSSP
jgi:ribosomal-protein-serine acetyltransferase